MRTVYFQSSPTLSSLALVNHPVLKSHPFYITFRSTNLWRGSDPICSVYRWTTHSPLYIAVTTILIVLLAASILSLLVWIPFHKHPVATGCLLFLLFFLSTTSLLSFLPCVVHWDVTLVTIHELGHVLGLGHESKSSCGPHERTPVMHPAADAIVSPCVTRSEWESLSDTMGETQGWQTPLPCEREEVCVTKVLQDYGRNGILLSIGVTLLILLLFWSYNRVTSYLRNKRRRTRIHL